MVTPTQPKPTALDRFLRTHRRHCRVWLFSLQKERTCTCGRDAAIKELEEILKRAEVVQMEMVME